MPHFEGAAAQQSAGCSRPHNSCKMIFFGERRYHLTCAGSVLIHQQNDTPMKRSLPMPLGDNQDRFLHKRISGREPEESRFVRRDSPKTGELLSAIATLPALSCEAVAHF